MITIFMFDVILYLSMYPPKINIAIAETNVPPEYMAPQSPWDKSNACLISPANNEIKKVCPKQELKYKRAVANNHLAFLIIKFIRYQSNR